MGNGIFVIVSILVIIIMVKFVMLRSGLGKFSNDVCGVVIIELYDIIGLILYDGI